MAIYLTHPETGGRMIAQDINGDGGEAQARLYEARDWQRIDGVLLAASEWAGRPLASLDDLTKEELVAFAEDRQVVLPAKARKEAIVEAVTDAFGPVEEAALADEITQPPADQSPETTEES